MTADPATANSVGVRVCHSTVIRGVCVCLPHRYFTVQPNSARQTGKVTLRWVLAAALWNEWFNGPHRPAGHVLPIPERTNHGSLCVRQTLYKYRTVQY